MQKQGVTFEGSDRVAVVDYRKALDEGTKFIPLWVKVTVAIVLGLGTMIGWKRIVITVGEKIGKVPMTYAQGASAELVAASTIAVADMYGLPVSTTQVLSSGVAGSHGGRPCGSAVGHCAQLGSGLGADPPCGNRFGWQPLLLASHDF